MKNSSPSMGQIDGTTIENVEVICRYWMIIVLLQSFANAYRYNNTEIQPENLKLLNNEGLLHYLEQNNDGYSYPIKCNMVLQLSRLEHMTVNHGVLGSSPGRTAIRYSDFQTYFKICRI